MARLPGTISLQSLSEGVRPLGDHVKNLTTPRVNGEYCDVEIITSGIAIRAHRFVLLSASPYFKKKLSEIRPGDVTFKFPSLRHDVMLECVSFMYTGRAVFPPYNSLDKETVKQIFEIYDKFHLTDYINQFYRYLVDNVSPGSLVYVTKICHGVQDEDFTDNLRSYIVSHTHDIFDNDVLTLSDLLFLLTAMEDWKNGYDFWKWKAISIWTNARSTTTSRKVHFWRLIKKVEFRNLNEGMIIRIPHESLTNWIPSTQGCFTALAFTRERSRALETRRSPISEIVICDKKTTLIYQLDIATERWFKVYHAPMYPSEYLQVTSYKGRIYAGNGRELWRYDTFSWALLCVTKPKSSAVLLDGRYNQIIGCGEHIAMVSTCHVVTHHIETGECENLRNRLAGDWGPANGSGFCVASSDKKIYVIGGRETEHSVVEIYLKKRTFTYLRSLKHSRLTGTACCLHDTLVIFGGSHAAVECYHVKTKRRKTVEYTRKINEDSKAFLLNNKHLYFIEDTKRAVFISQPICFDFPVIETFKLLVRNRK